MRRRIISAALTSSRAGWTAGLRGRDGDEHSSTEVGVLQTNPGPAESNPNSVPNLLDQIGRLRLQLSHMQARLRDTQSDLVASLAAAAEAKDPPGQQHSLHVAYLAQQLACAFPLSAGEVQVIRTAAMLHDVGKIGIPDAILTKPGPLTAEEYRVVKRHPVIGAAILRLAPWLRREVPLVLHHHEWYDGRGYPSGLRGEKTPFGARLLHVADAIDAMLSPRSYKQPYDIERVCTELLEGRGTQFDPVIAEAATNWLKQHLDELGDPPRSQPVASAESRR